MQRELNASHICVSLSDERDNAKTPLIAKFHVHPLRLANRPPRDDEAERQDLGRLTTAKTKETLAQLKCFEP